MPDKATISGEDRLIADYFAPLATGMPGAFGLQDDCAALTPEPGHDLVLKTDAIAEGVHFLSADAPTDVAWKALAVNVSDLAAKAAKPVGYLMSLSFPEAPTTDWLRAFAGGLREAQDHFGIGLLGGDTDRRPNAPLSVTIMVIGTVPTGRMVRRGACQAGDAIYVTGTLGDSAIGLRLRSGAIATPDPVARAALERRYLRPEPRTALRSALLAHARAAMDLSDGLVKDLGRMCRASGVAAEVEVARLPLSAAAKAVMAGCPGLDELPLTGGDDYEVLACIPLESTVAFEAAAKAAGVAVTRIGTAKSGTGVTVIGPDGQLIQILQKGYDHFSRA
jgi:thiamine-monophosphate kinase